ncbi:MAG: aminotransferase class V-fold PLP-dependent enzyme [Marinovum sp.]|nr:aminotransferase class V-fold PLP-dependent enzyme [Marinovum sp.]
MSLQNPIFIPGPTNMPEVLRRACDLPTIDHRSAAFPTLLAAARSGVQSVLKSTSAQVFIFPATGTGGWETALANTLRPGDAVLAVRNGMFSHKWIKMCRDFGLEVVMTEVPWGEGFPVDWAQEQLEADKDHKIKAVLVTHNETATGVRSDVAAVRSAIDAAGHPALFFVDGVSSIGSMEFKFDDWDVDVAVTGSQKGFMLPAGLGITAFSDKAMRATDQAGLPRGYFNIQDMAASYAAGGYPYTPAYGLLNGLKEACDMLLDEGLDAVFTRHSRIANGVRAAVQAWGLEICAAHPDLYSETVTAIRTPARFDAGRVVAHAEAAYGVSFGAGLGDVAGKVFRIGHLGSLTDVMTLSGIATAEMTLVDLGLDITLGAGVAAAQNVYRQGKTTTFLEAAE